MKMKPSEEQEHNLRRTCGTCHCAYLFQDSDKALFIQWKVFETFERFFFRMLTFEGPSSVFTGEALPAVHVQYSWEAFWVPK